MFDSLLPLKLHLSRTLASKSLIWRVLVPNHWVPGNIVHEFHWVLPTKSRVKAVNPRIPALRGNYKQKTLRISRTQGDSRRLKDFSPNPMVFCWIIMFPIVQLPIGCPGASDPASSSTMSPGRPRPTTWREGYNNSAPLRTVPVHGTRGNPGEPGGTRGNPGELGELSPNEQYGYGSIPIIIHFSGMNIHLPSFTIIYHHLPAILGFIRCQGFDP